jgi:hypothetical protein
VSAEVRRIALRMMDAAHQQRNAAEWRLWSARDEVTKHRGFLLEAQQAEAIAQRDYDRAQEFLETVWTDATWREAAPSEKEDRPL